MNVGAAVQPVDIVVAGAGVVGLVLAIALARAGFQVASLGPVAAQRNGRTVALLDGSVRMLAALGIWPALAPLGAPLATMRIVDGTRSLFRVPPVAFHAAELGLAAFGQNVENADLVEALAAAAEATPGLVRRPALLSRHTVRGDAVACETADGARIVGRLLVAADGVHSPVRQASGIGVRQQAYPQTALTLTLNHDAPHRDTSTEIHTRQGPFTLVPLRARADEPHRSSLVWVMAPEAADRRKGLASDRLAAEIERMSGFLLGHVRVGGQVGVFPIRRMVAEHLVAARTVLAGEAAHALPPIGAQGLNLSLRDAAVLLDHLSAARAAGRDIGGAAVLAAYARARLGDVALRAAGVDALNRALLADLLPVDLLRGAGLLALGALPGLRRAVMRQGLQPQHAVPSLMQ